MFRMKYLTLALVVLVVALASSMAFATDWVSLQYSDEALTTTAASIMLVPEANDFSAERYSDVPVDNWAWAQIEEDSVAASASSPFIVGGYGDGSYQPAFTVTRGSMAVFIARAAGYTDEAPAEATFSDVPTNYWAFAEVEAAVANGVVMGYPDGLYRPATEVTRDQMAVYIQRAAVLTTVAPVDDPFGDVATDFWAAPSIVACVDAGIVAGYADGLYRPALKVTRDQMAVFVWRGLVRDQGDVVLGGPAVSDDAWLVPAGGPGTSELFQADAVTATGANTINDNGTPDDPEDDFDLETAPDAVVFVALDAVQVPDGDVVFEVSHVEVNDNGTPLDDTDDFDETIVDSTATETIDAAVAQAAVSGSAVYLVVSYQIPSVADLGNDGLPEDYTVTVTLPNGGSFEIGTFTIDAP